MTDYNDKARAVILAAIMVLSVFAGTVAFSGSAAAATGDADVSNSSVSPDGSSETVTNTTVTHDVSFDFTAVDSGVQSSVELTPNNGDITNAQNLQVTNASGESVASSDASVNSGTLTITVTNQNSSATASTLSVSADVTVDWADETSGTGTLDYVTYEPTGGAQANSGSLTDTVSFSQPVRAGPDGTGTFDTGDGTGYVFDGATVFQGETDTFLGGYIGKQGVTKTAGNAEGVPLETPNVPQDQPTGLYTTTGDAGSPGVTVQTPRVTTLDVENSNGEDISGGSVREGTSGQSGSGDLTVIGAWNFDAAENLEMTVEDESGLDVTNDVTNNAVFTGNQKGTSQGSQSVSQNEVGFDLSLADSGTGTYTIELAGTDDLDFGQASQSTTVTVTGDDDASLEFDQSSATRGEDVRFEITGSDAGDRHVVLIDGDDFRDGLDNQTAQRVFRNVGDTVERGVVVNAEGSEQLRPGGVAGVTPDTTGSPTYAGPTRTNFLTNDNVNYAYAIVEIDDDTGVGVGQVETRHLDATDVEVQLYEQGFTGQFPFNAQNSTAVDNETDDFDLTVEEGDIEIDQPQYLRGQQRDHGQRDCQRGDRRGRLLRASAEQLPAAVHRRAGPHQRRCGRHLRGRGRRAERRPGWR